jgi:hypothetical protein
MKRAQQFWHANRNKLTTTKRASLVALATIAVAFIWATASQTQANAASNVFSIKGVGTAGYISKFLDNYTIGNSGIFENLGNVGIGTAAPQAKLDVLGNVRIEGTGSALVFPDGSVVHNRAELIGPQGVQRGRKDLREQPVLQVQPGRRVHRVPRERTARATPGWVAVSTQ